MKGNDKIIAKLNDLLSDELTAINQYMVHSEMCDNWGYEKLHKAIEKRAIDEMKHAERLIGRILFLEGKPVVSTLKGIHIGGEVQGQHKNDWMAEDGADQIIQRRDPAGGGDRRQRQPRTDGIDPQGRRDPYRLDRGATRPDRTDGDPELSGRADGLKFGGMGTKVGNSHETESLFPAGDSS